MSGPSIPFARPLPTMIEKRRTATHWSQQPDDIAIDKSGSEAADTENSTNRVRVEWVAKSLTSIAPRYQAKSGECSVYSCLTQFTAPELLTGKSAQPNV